jgi:hypothetical protein
METEFSLHQTHHGSRDIDRKYNHNQSVSFALRKFPKTEKGPSEGNPPHS